MKPYILISFMLLVGCSSFGQKKDNKANGFISDAMLQSDTVEVIMLVCDTSEKYSINNSMVLYFCDTCKEGKYGKLRGKEKNDTINRYHISITYWQYGYEVHGIQSAQAIFQMNGDGTITEIHNRYLDIDKKPLPINIIIWQTINIK